MKNRVLVFLLAFVMAACSISGSQAYAAGEENTSGERTDKYVMQYLNITVPDTYIQLTTSLKNSDSRWSIANVTDPSNRKKEFENRNVIADYFDPETNTNVYFISKSDSVTLDAFDTTEYTDEQMIEFAKTLISEEEGIKIKYSAYKHPEMEMFKIEIEETGENGDRELVYGTIVNGMLIQFSMDTQYIGSIKEDGSFRDEILFKILDGTHFIEKMTREEYEARVRKTWIRIGCFFGAGILLMIVLFIISKHNQKQKKKRVKLISERLYSFRERKKSGEVDLKNVKYEIETDYNKNLLQTYCTYNTWFRNIKRDGLMAVIYVGLVGTAFYLGSTFVLILGIGCALILLYARYSKNEKYQENLLKRYDLKKKKSVTAEYRFYEEFFTQSGIDSISEYTYTQIYKVANYHGYMLLYISEENALIIDIEKIPEDKRLEFIRFVVEKSRI